jgi:hypothetical protein
MTDEYEIPTEDTGHEPGTFLMVLTALRPFTLYETTKGWTREKPEDGSLVEAYNKIEWVFADDEGVTGSGNTSTARSERSTLFAWATGLGMAPAIVLDRSKPIPSSQLIGREAMVTFAHKNGYSRISSVVPAPRARTPQPVAANTNAVSQPGGPVREIIPPQPGPAMVEPTVPLDTFGTAGPQPAATVPADELPF